MAETVTQKRIPRGLMGEQRLEYIVKHEIDPTNGFEVSGERLEKARRKLEAIRAKKKAKKERRENAHARLQKDKPLWDAWLAFKEAKSDVEEMQREAIDANQEKAAKLNAVRESLKYDLAEVEAEQMAGEITEAEAEEKRAALEERVQAYQAARDEKLAAERALPKLQEKVTAAAEALREAHRAARADLVHTLIGQVEDVLSTMATLKEKEKDMEIVGMKGVKAPPELPNESALPTFLRTGRLQTWIKKQRAVFSER